MVENKENKKCNIYNSIGDKLDFQIFDWNTYHEIDGDDEESYIIQLFGRTMDDKDVCLKVMGFTPFFFVEVPDEWEDKEATKFVDALKNKVKWCVSKRDKETYSYDIHQSLVDHRIVKKHKFYNFNNKKSFTFIMLIFKSLVGMREFSNTLASPLLVNKISDEKILYQRYESNIEPHLRFMHINNLSSCGWVSIDKSKLTNIPKYSGCDYSYSVKWTYVKPIHDNNDMAPFKLLAYDIECISCDENFPQAVRKSDKIIQIGMTLYRYGSMNCYEKHIVVLKECNKIKDSSVYCYKTEKGMIRGWAQKISELRPDVISGYNIFGFDDKYIFDRIKRIDEEQAIKKGIEYDELENKFIDEILTILGKVNNSYLIEMKFIKSSLTRFETKNLSSSALGENVLKFFQIPGIISIDMMKVIQRDHRLVGYKLDNVSANFITEGAIKIVEDGEQIDGHSCVNIYTKSTKALDKHAYIQIMVDDGYSSTALSEGAKYRVNDIQTISENVKNDKGEDTTVIYQCIKTIINKKDIGALREVMVNKLLKVYWTFAKDDMHHTLINKYFAEGDPKKIKQIAKYCLKDCMLVNLLMAKLEIIVNSIGMASVCHVPLSYIFLRGQGVKIFSLVSKKCREKNFLIPVLRKNKEDLTGDENDGYEGATVITPKPGVYLSPIGVLDYSSLYPNSMREKNLSHECYINDAKYINIKNHIYHHIEIKLKDKKGKYRRNIDGTIQVENHSYAQEIITEEQINEEMKSIFEKIESNTKNKINNIKKQNSYTHDNIKEKIVKEEKELENKIKSITDDEELSKSKQYKRIEALKEKFKNEMKPFVECNKRISNENKFYEEKINKISNDKNMCDSTKKKILIDTSNNYNNRLKTILDNIDFNTDTKQELTDYEKEKMKQEINFEKGKKYNTVNGHRVRYGILAEILTELLNKRKDTNRLLEKEKDPSKKSVLNSRQLALKITANSLYGQTGAPTSPIFFMPIAASTTAIGRERLYFAKKIVDDNFEGAEVIYGDSVTGDTPVIYKNNNSDSDISCKINITTFENLHEYLHYKWKPYDEFKINDTNRKNKQQLELNNDIQVWSSSGWSNVVRIIRHKTTKKIYRVLTHSGCIDVTEDHSLLDKNKQMIKPTSCPIGTELLHGFMNESMCADQTIKADKITCINKIHKAYIWGFFMRNGISVYDCKAKGLNLPLRGQGKHSNNIGNIWSIKHKSLAVINKCKQYLSNIYDTTHKHKFKVIHNHDQQSSKYYKLVLEGPNTQSINNNFIKKYFTLFYNQYGNKIIPNKILNSTNELKQSFFNGYMDAQIDSDIGIDDINKNNINKNDFTIEIDTKISAQCLFYLIKSLGYNIWIDSIPHKKNTYRLVGGINCIRDNCTLIKENDCIGTINDTITETDSYVYDIETEDGTFHAGIGELIVKNTDSIFINFHVKDKHGNEITDKTALIETIRLSQKAANLINNKVPKPQSIIYEKSLHPFILVAKKKYVGLLFGDNPDKYYLKSMGIVLKRRDNAPIVKIVVGGIIDYILKHRDIDKAVEYTREVLKKLMSGKYPIDKFIISKTLRGNYKQKINKKTGKKTSLPAHKVLADRMAERDPGNKPQINDRISFVYVVKDMGNKKKKDILQGDLIEHPEYVVQHGLSIDYLYYLEHQIINPAQQILELMMPTRKVERMFNEFIIMEQNKRLRRQPMDKWTNNRTTNGGSKTSNKNIYSSTLKNKNGKNTNKHVAVTVTQPTPDSLIDKTHKNLPYIGKTRRLENQNMNKWLQTVPTSNNDNWNPELD